MTVAALLAGSSMNAGATQAPGDDVVAWNTNWSWTYTQTFNYNDGQGTNVTVNENVTYTNTGSTTFDGQSAYNVSLNGTITGGSGTANASGQNVNLKNFSGTVTGNEYIRRSDQALLQETQHQQLHATASLGFISTGVDATIDLTLTPNPGWRTLDFPLNNGDSWQENEDVAYTGGFTYNAGTFGSGSSPFDGDFPFVATANVTKPTISVPIGSVATDEAAAQTSDGSAVDNQWYSPAHSNLAQEHLRLPLSDAVLTLDRYLSNASIGTSGPTLSETITPSLSCAGGPITVSGRLSSGASGVPISARLDESVATAGTGVSAGTTTTTNGNYSLTLTTPGISDGASKNGSRGNWGVIVDASSVPASAVATSVVTLLDCTTLTNTGAAGGPQNGSATVSATLADLANPANAAGRQVTFSLGGGASVTATTNSSGVATTTLPVNGPVRSTTLTETFAGTSTLAAATTTVPFAVTVDPTSTSVVAHPSSVTVGNPVTFTATVTPQVGSGPTGTVQFVVDGNNFGAPVPLSGGSATSAALSTLPAGDHHVVAIYSGDANFGTSTSPSATVHVRVPGIPSTTALSAQPGTQQYGQDVTFTATVAKNGTASSDPSGSVTFTDGTTTLGTSALVGNGDGTATATLDTSDLGVGTHNVIATYSGDDTFDPSTSSPAAVTVTPADTTTTVGTSATAPVTGQAVTYTATVARSDPGAGTPSGTVELFVDGADTGDGETLSGGQAVFNPVTSLTAGDHTIRVVYSGDANFTGGSGSTPQHVDRAATAVALTASPSPSAEDQAITLTATVAATAPGSGNPTGTVTFRADGNSIGASSLSTTPDGQEATVTIATLPPGGHTLTAVYNGDDNYTGASSAEVDQTVLSQAAQQPTTTHLTSSVNPSTYGQLITFTAAVSANDSSAGTPQGTVQFSLDGTNIGTPVSVDDGVAVSATIASPDPGDHLVIAAYLPGDGFAASGDTLTQTIADAGVHVGISSSAPSSSYGQGVTFHASVASAQVGTGVPTGQVQFFVDAQPLGSAVTLSGGAATSPATSTLTPGAHTVTAVYSGDVDFVGDTASMTQNVGLIGTSTTVSAAPPAPTYGGTVTFTATVTPATNALGVPDGSVTFLSGSTTLGSAPVAPDGTATLSTAALNAGTNAIKATYGGSATFATSTSAVLNLSVARAPTTLTADPTAVKNNSLKLPPGQLRAHLSWAQGPLAHQTIVFKVGTKTVCTVPTDDTGTAGCNGFAYMSKITGAKGYTATFAGTSNFLPSTAKAGVLK